MKLEIKNLPRYSIFVAHFNFEDTNDEKFKLFICNITILFYNYYSIGEMIF